MDSRPHLVLDTGSLLEFFVLRFQAETRTSWWLRSFKPPSLPIPALQEAFLAFLPEHRGHLTTSPGVVAELHRHFLGAEKKCVSNKREFLTRVWSIVCGQLRDLEFSEETCRLAEMKSDLLPSLGPVDLGLMEVARHTRPPGGRAVTVLTIDKRLVNECRANSIGAELVVNAVTDFHKSRG